MKITEQGVVRSQISQCDLKRQTDLDEIIGVGESMVSPLLQIMHSGNAGSTRHGNGHHVRAEGKYLKRKALCEAAVYTVKCKLPFHCEKPRGSRCQAVKVSGF